MSEWHNKITIYPPINNAVISTDLEMALAMYLYSSPTAELHVTSQNLLDASLDHWTIVFTTTNSHDLNIARNLAKAHPSYAFRIQYADVDFVEEIGDVTFDAGVVLTEEIVVKPSFDDYHAFEFKSDKYFKRHCTTVKENFDLAKNPMASPLMLTEFLDYIYDEYQYSDDNELVKLIKENPNFPKEELSKEPVLDVYGNPVTTWESIWKDADDKNSVKSETRYNAFGKRYTSQFKTSTFDIENGYGEDDV